MEAGKEKDGGKEAGASMVDWSTYAECQRVIPPWVWFQTLLSLARMQAG